MPVTPICVGDTIEVSFTYMSLMGTLLLDDFQWLPIQTEALPNQTAIREYNRSESMTPDRNKLQKYFADLSRVCDVEDTVCEWFDKTYYEMVATDCLKMHVKH